jgi:hypothetical protein
MTGDLLRLIRTVDDEAGAGILAGRRAADCRKYELNDLPVNQPSSMPRRMIFAAISGSSALSGLATRSTPHSSPARL